MSKTFSKYIIVGLANTGLTAAIILLLTYLGMGVYLSNAVGYIAGICLSFVLNTLFTFSAKLSANRLIKFLLVCAISYIVNLVAIKTVLFINPGYIYIAQLIGMALYTITGFYMNKKWAMK